MLKIITTVRENPESLRVHLYGQFTGEDVPEIEKALSGQSADIGKVVLDLSNVTVVDCAAMLFLCGAKSRNVANENIPSYVTLWIDQEGRCGSAHSYPSEKRSARRDITNSQFFRFLFQRIYSHAGASCSGIHLALTWVGNGD